MKRLLLLVALLLNASIFTGCSGGGSDDGYLPDADQFVEDLNYYYGYSYDDFTLIKRHGEEAYSYCVVYDYVTDQYIAYNLDIYYPGMHLDDYFDAATVDDVIGDLTDLGDGNYYSWDYDVVFEETSASSKDLEKVGAFMEEKKLTDMGEKLSAEFGLSEERGIQIAKLANQWGTLKKKRSLTKADANNFSKELLGVSLTDAADAYKKSLEGDKTDLNDLFDKAAEVNGTSPERMNKIFEKVLNK
jgi:hypothetical protein